MLVGTALSAGFVALLLLLLQDGDAKDKMDSKAEWMQALLKLDNLVTDRINRMLKRYAERTPNIINNGEFIEQYNRLGQAAELSISQLDEKIATYNAYRFYDEQRQKLEQDLQAQILQNWTASSVEEANHYKRLKERLQNALSSTNAHKEYILEVVETSLSPTGYTRNLGSLGTSVMKLLKMLGFYDSFNKRVFDALFSDEAMLKKLKKKLKELDDGDSKSILTIWDLIFGLI